MVDDTAAADDRSAVRERLRQAFLTGLALTIPLVLTLVVLQIALDLVSQAVSPIVAGFELVFGADQVSMLLLEVVTVVTLVVLVLLIGFVAEYHSGQSRLSAGFDALMARIPGLGSVYTGTRRMSEVLIAGNTQSFQEVKLVEFPREDTFMVGFLTAEPPDSIREVAGAPEMQTLFVPLAPNPVMGGFLLHLPEERVHDVDLTVEEGVQSIVTSGAALDPRVEEVDAMSGDLVDGHPFEDVHPLEAVHVHPLQGVDGHPLADVHPFEGVDVHPFEGHTFDWGDLDVGVPVGSSARPEDDEGDDATGSE